MDLSSTTIHQLPLEQLLPLVYGEALNISLEDFEYNKYHPLVYNEEHILAFIERILPGSEPAIEDWQDYLDQILLVLLTEDVLVADDMDYPKAYYWHSKDGKFILYSYDTDWGDINRDTFDTLEKLIETVLAIDNDSPERVPINQIREKDRKALECIFPGHTHWEKDGYLRVVKPPTELSITPINRAMGWYIYRRGNLHIIGTDSTGEILTAIYSGDDIRLIQEILNYNQS